MDLPTWIRAQWDRCAAWLFIVAGGIILLLGWFGVSRYAYPADQMPYIISGGIGGLLFVGVGAMLWLSADLRDEWRMLRRIDEALRAQSGVALVVDEDLPPVNVPPRSRQSDRYDAPAVAPDAPTADTEIDLDNIPARAAASAASRSRGAPKRSPAGSTAGREARTGTASRSGTTSRPRPASSRAAASAPSER